MTSHLLSLHLDDRGPRLVAKAEPGYDLLADFFETALAGIEQPYADMLVALRAAANSGSESGFATQAYGVDIRPGGVTFEPDFNARPFTLSLEDFVDSLDTYASYFDGRRELRRLTS